MAVCAPGGLSSQEVREFLERALCSEARWEPSVVYLRKEGREVRDEERRRSAQWGGTSPEGFEALDVALARLKDAGLLSETSAWRLLRGHWDVLRYEPGDFFGEHTDFEPVKGDLVRCWTLLVSLVDVECGGETVVVAPNGETAVLGDLLAVGGVALLPADSRHAGLPVGPGALKMMLKGDVLEVLRPAEALDLGGALLPKEDARGVPVLEALMTFQGSCRGVQSLLDGFTLEDRQALVGYLCRVPRPPNVPSQGIVDFLCLEEAQTPLVSELLARRGPVLTADASAAEPLRRLGSTARWLPFVAVSCFSEGFEPVVEPRMGPFFSAIADASGALVLTRGVHRGPALEDLKDAAREAAVDFSAAAQRMTLALVATALAPPARREEAAQTDDAQLPFVDLEPLLADYSSKAAAVRTFTVTSEESEYCNDGDFWKYTRYEQMAVVAVWGVLPVGVPFRDKRTSEG